MYQIGELIDGKYTVINICSNQGGMGTVLFVKDASGTERALKFCDTPEYYDRFRREIRLVKKYNGNSKVVEIIDSSLDSNPPYFVMPKAEKGNLNSVIERVQSDLEFQEFVFFRMIDCLSELHKNDDIHRDIKPENFLIHYDERIIVSDFGLAKEPDSSTRCTLTMQRGGTVEFAPPEFFTPGGFKHASYGWDIHSLGKSFYRMLVDRDARLITEDGIHPSLFYVIEKCSKSNVNDRYKNLSELKQSLRAAYDIIQKRIDPQSEYIDLLAKIEDRLNDSGKYSGNQVIQLMDLLFGLDKGELFEAIREFPKRLIRALANNDKFNEKTGKFIDHYRDMFDDIQDCGFHFAEIVADNMQIIFEGSTIDSNKCKALDLSVYAAIKLHRFAAMDTCRTMIESINSDGLALPAVDVIEKYKNSSFVEGIESSSCKHHLIKNKLKELRDS